VFFSEHSVVPSKAYVVALAYRCFIVQIQSNSVFVRKDVIKNRCGCAFSYPHILCYMLRYRHSSFGLLLRD